MKTPEMEILENNKTTGSDSSVPHFDQNFRQFLNEKVTFRVGPINKCRLKVNYKNS